MKVTIEFDLPEGQEMPKVEDILALTSPDWHIEKWHIDDVLMDHQWLTKDQAREVLVFMEKYHDATIGINWEFIAAIVGDKFPAPEEDES